MLVTAILCSFILGVVFTLIIQFLFIKYQLNHTPEEEIKHKPQFTDFKLPKVQDNHKDSELGIKPLQID